MGKSFDLVTVTGICDPLALMRDFLHCESLGIKCQKWGLGCQLFHNEESDVASGVLEGSISCLILFIVVCGASSLSLGLRHS